MTAYGLTPREVAVLSLLAEGLGDKQIARRLGLAPTTVPVFTRHIYSKMGSHTRTGAAVRAVREGIIR